MAIIQSSFDHLYFTIGQRRTLLLRRCLTTLSGLRPRMNLPLRYRRSITTKVMSSD